MQCVGVENSGVSLSVQPYDPARGAVADVEGGTVKVSFDNGEVLIVGDEAGLRDLARWCLVLVDPALRSAGAHVHLDPNVTPLSVDSLGLTLAHKPPL